LIPISKRLDYKLNAHFAVIFLQSFTNLQANKQTFFVKSAEIASVRNKVLSYHQAWLIKLMQMKHQF